MKAKRNYTIYFLGVFLLFLLGISLLLMYHARFISSLYAMHFEKQLLWIGIGCFFLILFFFIPAKYFFHFSFGIYLVNIFLLIAVLFFGTSANGAKAWIRIGGFQFQPSEFMKLSYSLFLASYCSNRRFYTLKDEFKFLFMVLIFFFVPSILVFLEPDTGAIIFFLLITIIILWNTKISRIWFWIFLLLLCSILGGFFYCYFFQRDLLIQFLGTSFFYRAERVLAFGSGMQIEHALIALGSAPIWSFNLFKTGIYIPEAPTDFVFALSSNVFGLLGPICILLSYVVLDFCFLTLIKREQDETCKLFSYAFLTIFFFSQFENIGMNLGLLPIMGIPLPFLSYGGSCMIVFFIFLGILLQKKSFTLNRKTFKINYR